MHPRATLRVTVTLKLLKDQTVLLIALALAFAFMALTMTLAWWTVLKTRNGGWTDVFWTFGTGIAGVLVSLTPWMGMPGPRQWLVAALVAVWSIRLGSYIAGRVGGGHADPRYVALTEEWGSNFSRNLYGLAIVQAPATTLLCVSIAAAALRPGDALMLTDYLGALILLAGIGGEALADEQMRRFRADPSNKGKVMDRGLWGLSRHPNYFFEWVVWLAYPVIGIDLSGGWVAGWAALVAPVVMYVILRYMTGVPPLEKVMLKSRGDAYRDYQSRVGALLPRLNVFSKDRA